MTQSKILYGGQAVIEGVMMRGRNYVTCAVRRENGQIQLRTETVPKSVYSGAWSKTPFLRALPLLWDTLVLGTRMLMWSANVQAADGMAKQNASKGETGTGKGESAKGEPEKDKVDLVAAAARAGSGKFELTAAGAEAASGKAHSGGIRSSLEGESAKQPAEAGASPQGAAQASVEEGLPPIAIYSTLILSLALGLGLFFALPVLIASWLGNFGVSPFWNNVIEGLIRLLLFLGYLIAIGRIENIQRVFQYHGAEHKTIAAFEAGAELVPDQVQRFSKEHPRCGTGFVLTVVVISILFFVLLGDLPLGLRLASRILLIPLVAAVSYELIRFASQHRNIVLFDLFVVRPSLALQSLTTRQPTDDMVEVAVAAFRDVRDKELALAMR